MEQLAQDLETMVRTPLHASHVEAMKSVGEVVEVPAGEFVLTHGEPMTHFMYVLEGEVEALDAMGMKYGGGATLGPTQFIGEVNFLNDGNAMLSQRTVQDTTFVSVERDAMLTLMSQIPEMSDIVVTVFAARRRRMLEKGLSSLTLIGADLDRGVSAVAAFASRNKIPFRSLDLGGEEAEEVAQTCALMRRGPAVIYGRDTVVEDVTPRGVAKLLGIDVELTDGEVFDVLIVGGGPAGIAAGVYAGSEGLSALVLEDLTVGGQAGTSSRIENYMGFPTGISGADLCWRGEVQAMKFGTRFAMPRRATHLEVLGDGTFCARLEDGESVCARSVVIATGVQYRKLGLERIEDFERAGIYYAATDLEARFCRETEVVVVGGGNSAGQAAMFLSRTAKHVHVLVRGPSLAASMSSYLSSRLESDPAITVHFHHELEGLRGGARLEQVTIRDKSAGASFTLDARAVFLMVGAAPNTSWLCGHVGLDGRGFVLTGEDADAAEGGARSTYETSLRGVFAVGDVRAGSTKRVASSVGEGSVVISKVWEHVRAGE